MIPKVGVLGLYKFIDLLRPGLLAPGGRRSPIHMIKVGAKLTSSLPFFIFFGHDMMIKHLIILCVVFVLIAACEIQGKKEGALSPQPIGAEFSPEFVKYYNPRIAAYQK